MCVYTDNKEDCRQCEKTALEDRKDRKISSTERDEEGDKLKDEEKQRAQKKSNLQNR